MNTHEGNGKTCMFSYIVGLESLNDLKLHMPSYCAWCMYVHDFVYAQAHHIRNGQVLRARRN